MDTLFDFICYSSLIMSIDIFIYGNLIPAISCFIGGYLAYCFGAGPAQEILLVVYCTFALFTVLSYLNLERKFWRELLSLEDNYRVLFEMRSFHNGLSLAYNIVNLVECIQKIVAAGKMKEEHLSADLLPVIGSWLQKFYEEAAWYRFDIFPSIETVKPESAAAAELIFAIGILFAEVWKFGHLTTIATYLNSVILFNNQLWVMEVERNEDITNNNVVDEDEGEAVGVET